ncbi:MAG: hypothetical protein HYZ37_18505 [Candidatus Solibacter usitatus]|nr:hypothetical protein [Candidatus Solibacter usitatus]
MDPENPLPPAANPEGEGSENKPVAFCRSCGKGLNKESVRTHREVVYCEEHLPKQEEASSQWSAPNPAPAPSIPSSGVSPGFAFVLGLIPGVGAIYNGQFGKAVVHLLITALVCSMAGGHSGSLETVFEMLVPVWFFYMAIEAYQTAKKRLAGEPLDEFSSIFPGQAAAPGFPLLPVLLIALGVIFLLDNLGLLRINQLIPYAGPIFLIVLGAYMLYARLRNHSAASEVSHERN